LFRMTGGATGAGSPAHALSVATIDRTSLYLPANLTRHT